MKKIIIILLCIVFVSKNFAMDLKKDLEQQIKEECEKEGIEKLLAGQLEDLDPLVGDTSCQIRAAELLELYELVSKQTLEKDSANLLDTNKKQFLMLCQLLTKSKEVKYSDDGRIILNEKSNYKLLSSDLTKKLGNGLLLGCQRTLAEISVNKIQAIAKFIGDIELIKAVSFVVLDDTKCFKRKLCACYPTVKLVLLHAIKLNIPLVVKVLRYCSSCKKRVHTINFIYKPDISLMKFIPCNLEEVNLNQSALLIEGLSINNNKILETEIEPTEICEDIQMFCNNFIKLDIIPIILANSAQHAQFTGQYKDQDIPYDELGIPLLKEEITNMREFARKFGCCRENKSLFLVDHICASTIKKSLGN